MALTLQQQLTVHNTGAEQIKNTTKCQTTRVTNKNEEIYQNSFVGDEMRTQTWEMDSVTADARIE